MPPAVLGAFGGCWRRRCRETLPQCQGRRGPFDPIGETFGHPEDPGPRPDRHQAPAARSLLLALTQEPASSDEATRLAATPGIAAATYLLIVPPSPYPPEAWKESMGGRRRARVWQKGRDHHHGCGRRSRLPTTALHRRECRLDGAPSQGPAPRGVDPAGRSGHGKLAPGTAAGRPCPNAARVARRPRSSARLDCVPSESGGE